MKLTVLGCMGWIPARNRQTCCYCLELENCDTLVVFDAGSGLARFIEPKAKEILHKYSNILLLLSHYHLDHISGLSFFSSVFNQKKIHIAAPGIGVYDQPAAEILNKIITPPVFGRTLDNLAMDLEISDLRPGRNHLMGIRIDTVLQKHSHPSLGIKIDNEVCYLTDTTVSETNVDFAANCRLLLHECWLDEQDYLQLEKETDYSEGARKTLNSHSSASKVAQAAHEAGVNELVLIHLNPSYDDLRLSSMEKDTQSIFNHCRLAYDWLRI